MKYWPAAFCVLFVMAFSGRAEATNVACYDWSCDDTPGTTHVCAFDAGCSSITQGSVWRYAWDFGDGASALTGSPTTSHTFSSSYSFSVVTLTVWLFGGTEPTVNCEILIFNIVGPPQPVSGRCPKVP